MNKAALKYIVRLYLINPNQLDVQLVHLDEYNKELVGLVTAFAVNYKFNKIDHVVILKKLTVERN